MQTALCALGNQRAALECQHLHLLAACLQESGWCVACPNRGSIPLLKSSASAGQRKDDSQSIAGSMHCMHCAAPYSQACTLPVALVTCSPPHSAPSCCHTRAPWSMRGRCNLLTFNPSSLAPPVPCRPAMNEVTWKRVMDWEQLHCEACQYPTLLKFQGKPHDLRWG